MIDVEQIIATHTRLARHASGDDHDVRIRRVGVVLRAEDVGVPLFNRHGLQQVEAFTLRHAFDDVDKNHVGELFRGNPVSGRGPHISRADDRDFIAHDVLSKIRSQVSDFKYSGQPEV